MAQSSQGNRGVGASKQGIVLEKNGYGGRLSTIGFN
jgi:hypothetical protein